MELDQLQLPSGVGWVKMRRKVLWGDEQAVESAVIATQREQPGQGLHAFKRQRVFQLIESWSLFLAADETVGTEGVPLPMEPASLDRLEPVDGDFLYKYARHRFENRGDIANPFPPASPESSPPESDPPASSV